MAPKPRPIRESPSSRQARTRIAQIATAMSGVEPEMLRFTSSVNERPATYIEVTVKVTGPAQVSTGDPSCHGGSAW
mgnify:CR=1 FL=1